MAKRILIVSYHFYPDSAVGARRMSELARYLCKEGHEVVVVTAKHRPAAMTNPGLALDLPNLRRIGIWQPPKLLPLLSNRIRWLVANRRIGIGRSSPSRSEQTDFLLEGETWLQRLKRIFHSLEFVVDEHKLWGAMAAVRIAALAAAKPFDAVISSGAPMSGHLAVLIARPLLRSRWIMDLRDPWCDQDHGRPDLHSRISRGINLLLERRAFASADAISVTTPSYVTLLRAKYLSRQDDVQLVLNGFDSDLELSKPPQGRLELLYAGSLYYNRDPFPLLKAILNLVSRPDVDRSRVRFRLFGSCQSWQGVDLASWLMEQGLQDCVLIYPQVSVAAVRRAMTRANVLVNFAQGQPLQIPAKMFDYLAACREILLIAEPESDTAWLARQAGCGRILAGNDVVGMEVALNELYDKYVVKPQHHEMDLAKILAYSRKSQNERFLDLMSATAVAQQEISP